MSGFTSMMAPSIKVPHGLPYLPQGVDHQCFIRLVVDGKTPLKR